MQIDWVCKLHKECKSYLNTRGHHAIFVGGKQVILAIIQLKKIQGRVMFNTKGFLSPFTPGFSMKYVLLTTSETKALLIPYK